MAYRKESGKTDRVTILDLVEQGLYNPENMTDNDILQYIELKEKRDGVKIWFPYAAAIVN